MLTLLTLALAAAQTPADVAAPAAAAPPPAPPPAPSLAGQGAPLSLAGARVEKVEIVGRKRVEEFVLQEAIGIQPGQKLGGLEVQQAIRSLWATGYIQDVKVEALPASAPSTEGEPMIGLRFTIQEKPAIREIRFEGSKKIKEDDLREAVDIDVFTVPSEARIKANVAALREKYLEKGYYLVEITPKFEASGPDLVDLTFQIVENRKVLIQRVDITGNDQLADRKVKRYLHTKPAGVLPFLSSGGTFVESNLTDDVQIVQQVYLEEGYLDVQVGEPHVYLSPDRRSLLVEIHVEEGPQYRLGKISIEGDFVAQEGLTEGAARAIVEGATPKAVQEAYAADVAAGVAISPTWSPKIRRRLFDFTSSAPTIDTGDVFKLSEVQAVMSRISDLYGDQGYAFVNVVPVPQPDPESKVADLVLDVQRGDKMRIGKISVSGNDPTFDKVVRREIPLNEGDTYKGSSVRDAKARLERLGFFETVNVSTPKGDGYQTLDMNVEVKERPTGSFSLGLGYGSAESFLFTANVQKSNFLGLGYQMGVSANVSKYSQTGNLSFFDPHFLDSRWTFRVDSYVNNQDYYEKQKSQSGMVEIGRYLDARDDIRLSTHYQISELGLSQVDDYKLHLYGGQLYRDGLTSSLGLSLEIDKRNNRISATRGFRFSAQSELSGGFRLDDDTVASALGGDFNLWENQFNFRFYQPLVKEGDWLIFRYNTSFANIQSTDGSIVPWIHRYRMGGILSMRGYATSSLGPDIRAMGWQYYSSNYYSFAGTDDPSNADDRLVIGGTRSWVNNVELESPIIKAAQLSVVAFYDFGNTFGDVWGDTSTEPFALRQSYGAGVRWFSPIGPLRFEYGIPIDRYADERRAVFDFTIGSAF